MMLDLVEKDAARSQSGSGRGALSSRHDRLTELARAIERERRHPAPGSRTARLISAGLPKMAQKVVEESGEVVVDAMRGDSTAVIRESADLLYHLTVLWAELGIAPAEVWAEMDRRRALFGLAEKLPKDKPAG
jgi:phosphoribosyl-ATP pyrophosphohydrolase